MAPASSLDQGCGGPRITRRELVLVLVLVLAGAALRFAFPSRLAVEHFDEGVYASNIWFSEADGYRYPARHLYAPPLLPALVEWSIVLFGPGGLSVKLVSLLAGALTVPLVWWTARRWFGPEAGIAAAVLAACSDFHILFSRMVLTDALLCCWLLLAVYCAGEMLARGRMGWAIAAGVATGLAWSTKYNGWLPLAIAASGCVLHAAAIRWRPTRRAAEAPPFSLPSAITALAVMTVTALIVWSPALWDLYEGDRGGYTAVAANHRGYLVGWSGWTTSLWRQIANHRFLEGWLSGAAQVLAVMAAASVRCQALNGFTWNAPKLWRAAEVTEPPESSRNDRGDWRWVVTIAFMLTASAAWLGASPTIGVLALAGICFNLRARSPLGRYALPGCLLAVWFAGLSFATPFYHPYPRLTLPWLVAAWLGAGAMIGCLTRKSLGSNTDIAGTATTASRPRTPLWIPAASLAVCLSAIYFSSTRWTNRGVVGWQPQSGFSSIAASIFDDVSAETEANSTGSGRLILVYGEPGLFFQLAAAVRQADTDIAVIPVASLQSALRVHPAPTYLVTGPNALRQPDHQAALQQVTDRLQRVARYSYRPGDLIRLNWSSPPRTGDSSMLPDSEVRLYRLR